MIKKNISSEMFLVIILMVGGLALLILLQLVAWNWLMPVVFGTSKMSFWQMAVFDFLIYSFFGAVKNIKS